MHKHEQSESDSSLIKRLQRGDKAAFDVLFEKHRRGILAYLLQMSGDRGLAEDVTQECFIELVRRIESIDRRRGAKGWLYRVARNRMVDILRHRGHESLRGREYFVDAPGSDGGPEAGLVSRDRKARVLQALKTLPERERDVIMLRFYGELTFKEIARAVRRPLGTVLWQGRNGLHKLRRELEGDI